VSISNEVLSELASAVSARKIAPQAIGFEHMLNLGTTFLALAIVSLAVGFLFRSSEVADGLGKAMFGVFLILFFIVRFFGEENA
jgi:hypothetical protein